MSLRTAPREGAAASNGVSTPPSPPRRRQPEQVLSVSVPVGWRHRWGRLALGVCLVVLGALLTAWLVSATGHRQQVLVLVRGVPYGQPVAAADLGSTDVRVDPDVATVPASDQARIVGQIAATTLLAGTLLAQSQLTPAAPPQAGQVLVGLPVPADRLPAGGFAAGDHLLLVDTPPADADPPATDPVTIPVTVVRGSRSSALLTLDVTDRNVLECCLSLETRS